MKYRSKPLLIGIIIDVSSSMQNNWHNQDGRKMPRIEIVRDAINEQFKKFSLLPSDQTKRRKIDVFCLGMGFQRPMFWSDVQISYGQEGHPNTQTQKKVQSDVVCDLIALTELLPSQNRMKRFEIALNKKWQLYAHQITEHANLEDFAYEQLQTEIATQISESAYRKLQKGIPYKLYQKLYSSMLSSRLTMIRTAGERLEKHIQFWERKIDDISNSASTKYFEGMLTESRKLFEDENSEFAEFIEDRLGDFASRYANLTLTLLSLGHNTNRILENFDEQKVQSLAQEIYEYLDGRVRQKIARAWTLKSGELWISAKRVRASLNSTEIRALTEKCIQKYSWEILEQFVLQTVQNIFVDKFSEEVRELLPNLIGHASTREVTRPLKQVINLLPDSFGNEIYTNEFMFGSTPIGNAIERASLRFLDKSRKNREKILIIVSDGEFESEYPIEVLDLLKQSGVVVVSCYLASHNILSRLSIKSSAKWPDGAKMMFEMASPFAQSNLLLCNISKNGYSVDNNARLFYQINQSELLEEVFEAILNLD
ncbi:MAG: VWA domain-containing protein [Caldilineaceae bacterium]